MKIKTQDLTGAALDWAVAKCEGLLLEDSLEHNRILLNIGLVGNFGRDIPVHWFPQSDRSPYSPSTRWAQGGPIIEQEGIRLHRSVTGDWWASPESDPHRPVSGPTPLIAAMRCFVASRLGDEVDIPEEL